jgi:hypothetical protein
MEERTKYQFDPPVESDPGTLDDAVDLSVAGYALYYPLVSEWEHPDGIRFDQPRD